MDAANCPGPGSGTQADPFCKIQNAINAAAANAIPPDEIIVADGIYTGPGNKDLDFAGKTIKLRSAGGAAKCIIDCEGSGRGFYFHNGETAAARADGFTSRGANDSGVSCYSSSPTLTNCKISGNTASSGGGVDCYSSSPTLTNCTITENTATGISSSGGGVNCDYYSSPTLTNCTITGNSASAGGGIYCYFASSPTLTNCTISGNKASRGGGVYCASSSSPTLTNCILWGDTLPEIYGTPLVSYCDVKGGYAGTGNINADPAFAFADDFHLMPGSPCIDAGTNNPTGGLPGLDADGNPRALDGNGDGYALADMGALEFNPAAPAIALSPPAIEVFAYAGGTNPDPRVLSIRNSSRGVLIWQIAEDCPWLNVEPRDGSCQQDIISTCLSFDITGLSAGEYLCVLTIDAPLASNSPRTIPVTLHLGTARHVPAGYPTIQEAIDAATQDDWVLVADGIWTGLGNIDLDFGGKAISVRSLNGPANCIIDCQQSADGFWFFRGETATARVEGFTIKDARSGVRCGSSSPTLTNCTISGNTTTSHIGIDCEHSNPTLTNCAISGNSNGGGVGCRFSSPTLTNCMISGNTASLGGGVYCYSYSCPTLTNCTITGNRSNENYSGGGLYCDDHSSPMLNNCTISGNTASGSTSIGGGISCNSYSSPTLTNCTISGNRANGALRSGGGVYCCDSSPSLINCTISGNWAGGTSGSGGALYCYSSRPMLTNCILWGDTAPEINGYSAVVTYSNVQGGWPGTGNINADPLFVDAANGNYHLRPGSPCIDVGSNAAVPAGITTDIDGDPRILRGRPIEITLPQPIPPPPIPPETVDLGADEYKAIWHDLHRPHRAGNVPVLTGDVDGDGLVDGQDLQAFVGTYLEASGGASAARVTCDINHDGSLNAADVAAFVTCLLEGQCI